MTDNKQLAKSAANAIANLNTYGAVVGLLESGVLYDGRNEAASKIIKICKKQMANELAIYDKFIAQITSI